MKRKLMSLALCAAMVLTSAAMLASCADKAETTTAAPVADNGIGRLIKGNHIFSTLRMEIGSSKSTTITKFI